MTMDVAISRLNFPRLAGTLSAESSQYQQFIEKRRPWSAKFTRTLSPLVWNADKEKKIRRFDKLFQQCKWSDKTSAEAKEKWKERIIAIKDLESGQFTQNACNVYHNVLSFLIQSARGSSKCAKHVMEKKLPKQGNTLEQGIQSLDDALQEYSHWMNCLYRLIYRTAPLFTEYIKSIENDYDDRVAWPEPEDQNTELVRLDDEPRESVEELLMGEDAAIDGARNDAGEVASDPSKLHQAVREYLLLATRTDNSIKNLVHLARKSRFKKQIRDLPKLLQVPDHHFDNKKMMSLEDLMKNLFPDQENLRTEWITAIKQITRVKQNARDMQTTKPKSMTEFEGARHCEATCAIDLNERRCNLGKDLKVFIGVSQSCCSSCQAILEACKSTYWFGNSNYPCATSLPENIGFQLAKELVENLRETVRKQLEDNFAIL